MNLIQLGLNPSQQEYLDQHQGLTPGRVIKQHKDRYEVLTENGKVSAEVTGNLRFTAESSSDFPAVGDWVLMMGLDDLFLIHQILPRQTKLERQAVSAHGESQLIATNIDVALIVQSLDENFNLNRLERYLAIVYQGGIQPVVVLNKLDLMSEAKRAEKVRALQNRLKKGIKIICTSTVSAEGMDELKAQFESGKTYCLLGSSGVGKSSILNAIEGKDIQLTSEISSSNFKGRHTTTSREIILLSGGGLIVDTPGMREMGMADSAAGLDITFDQITALAQQCKFNDCTHEQEEGCAILEALDKGELDEAAWHNYQKLQRESQRFESSKAERRKKDKQLGKMYKQIQQMKRKNKY